MEEKRRDLDSTKQKKIIDKILQALSEQDPSFYYMATIDVAAEVKRYIHESDALSKDELELMDKLSRRDIQILLSLH